MQAVREHPELRFRRAALDDGTVCFEIVDGQKVPERHLVRRSS